MDFGFGNELINWIIGLGALAGAIITVSKAGRLLYQFVVATDRQRVSINSMQVSVEEQTKTMNEVVRQLMEDNRRRVGNEERLKQTEKDIRELRLDTKKRTDELTKSFKSIEDDIREIKESLLKGDE